MAVTSFAGRFRWYLRALGSNPLIRRSDRLEALVVLAVLVIALFAIPVAAHAGALVRDAGVRTAHDQALDRHAVDAVAVDGSTSLSVDFDGAAYVLVQWREGQHLRSEHVIAPTMVKANEPLRIWLNDAGRVVAAPLSPEDARLSALAAAGTLWVAIVACGVLLAYFVRRRLDRLRDRDWEHELNLLAHNDDGWANRHT